MLFHDSKYVSNNEVESDETDSDEIESDEEKSVDDEEDGLCKFSPALNSTMKMTCQDLSKILNVLGFSSEIVSTDESFDEKYECDEEDTSDDEFIETSNKRLLFNFTCTKFLL